MIEAILRRPVAPRHADIVSAGCHIVRDRPIATPGKSADGPCDPATVEGDATAFAGGLQDARDRAARPKRATTASVRKCSAPGRVAHRTRGS